MLILAGCTDTSIEGISIHTDKEFYATIEGSDSRTYVDDQIRLRWTAEDCITIFKKTTYNREFMFTGVTGANAGGFKQKSVDDDFWYGADVPYNYAVYPHSSTTQLDETDHFFTLTMPSEQTYVENSFGLGANTMVAASESGQLMFKNVGSYLRVRLYGKDIAVSSITLASKGNESIAGKAKVTPKLNGNPTCEILGTGKSIRLTCPEPVTISEDVDNPTDFWIVVPPVTLSKGFTVTVENEKGDTQVFEVTKPFTFERNLFTNMKREVSIASDSDTTPYVTFKADAEQTLTMSKAVETLEYSVGGDDWKELGTNTVTFGGTNGNLRLRGKSSIGTANNINSYSKIQFGNNTLVESSGDIRTLIDYKNYDSTNTDNARFCYLFYQCNNLKTAPELPATVIASDSYRCMFADCSNLTQAPELPAIILADNCYRNMFDDCVKLTSTPTLHATILAKNCYYCMFKGCTKLTTITQLPAKELTEYCYASMFEDCNNIIDPPALPATTLARYCYQSMFSGCSRLTNPPTLPATNLSEGCYSSMFSSCNQILTAPQLPATNLSKYCYEHMFFLCRNLSTAPELPATKLASNCYYGMFRGCENLTIPPKLPANEIASSCYMTMFQDCKKLIEAPKLPATILTSYCYAHMFSGCTSLTVSPELLATELVSYCYSSMFFGCSKLDKITMLALNTIKDAPGSLMNWTEGVATIGTFIKATEMTSLQTGSYGIPEGWTVVNYEDTFYDDGPPPMEEEGGNI